MADASLRTRLEAGVPVAAISIAVLLLVGLLGHHPQLSRQEAINAALSQQVQGTAHHAAKHVRESELERADPEAGTTTGPDFFVWVIAVSGDYAIPGEYRGGPPTTWTILVVKDQRPAQLWATWGGTQGSWPSFFDDLIDRN